LVDYNKIQALTTLQEGLPLSSLSAKIKAFNWDCIEINDGHSFDELSDGFEKLNPRGRPTAIVVHTIKGKGVKAFEHDPKWHARRIKGAELELGKKELGIL